MRGVEIVTEPIRQLPLFLPSLLPPQAALADQLHRISVALDDEATK